MHSLFAVNVDLLPMLMFEETSLATSATGVMESSGFDEEDVLTTQNTVNY